MTGYIIIKKEGSFFLGAFRGVVVLLLSLPHAVTSEAWLSDRACHSSRLILKGKYKSRAFQLPRAFSSLCLSVADSKCLEKKNKKEGECNAGHIVTSSDLCILHGLGCSGLRDMFVPVQKSWRHLNLITFFLITSWTFLWTAWTSHHPMVVHHTVLSRGFVK